jgi:hypothetical protein
MRLRTQNLTELWERFDQNTSASVALEEMRAQSTRGGEWDLSEVLRHHADDPIEDDDEISMRDAFDDLLAFFGCVEIASMIGFVPDPLPMPWRLDVASALCNNDLRRYYRTHYPLFLPDMLLARVAGVRGWREPRAPDPALFLEFLHISALLEDDPGVSMFLWFLDDGYHEQYEFADTLKILESPRRLVRALGRSPRRRNPAEHAVDGFRTFVSFSVALDDLLHRTVRFPLLQAAMWEYHAYWFRIVSGEVRDSLEEALGTVRKWLSSPTAKQLPQSELELLRTEATTSLKNVMSVVRRLTGRTYGQQIRQARAQIRGDSSRAQKRLQRHR